MKEETVNGNNTRQYIDENDEDFSPPWNLGALFYTTLWCMMYDFYLLAVLSCIPIISLVIGLYLMVYGNALAFKKAKFKNSEIFMHYQKKWHLIGKISCFISCFILLFFLIIQLI